MLVVLIRWTSAQSSFDVLTPTVEGLGFSQKHPVAISPHQTVRGTQVHAVVQQTVLFARGTEHCLNLTA